MDDAAAALEDRNRRQGREEKRVRLRAEGWSPATARETVRDYDENEPLPKEHGIVETFRKQKDPYELGLGDPPYSDRKGGRKRKKPKKQSGPEPLLFKRHKTKP